MKKNMLYKRNFEDQNFLTFYLTEPLSQEIGGWG